jgi:hypothetical protein
MDYTRITITFTPTERDVLDKLSQVDMRPPKEQLRFLLRSEAEKRGLWPIPSTPRPTPADAEVRP